MVFSFRPTHGGCDARISGAGEAASASQTCTCWLCSWVDCCSARARLVDVKLADGIVAGCLLKVITRSIEAVTPVYESAPSRAENFWLLSPYRIRARLQTERRLAASSETCKVSSASMSVHPRADSLWCLRVNNRIHNGPRLLKPLLDHQRIWCFVL